MSNNPLFRRKSREHILREAANMPAEHALNKSLTLKDLTAFGIAAIIGAGIFSTIGNAAADGGPAVSLLFVFTAIACTFSALCYAEFASSLPISGSAYTYAYHSFGELLAWIIGWDLLIEYAIGNIAVAISWSDYFTDLLHKLHIHIPAFLSMDYLSAARGYEEATILIAGGKPLSFGLQEAYSAWTSAPHIGGLKLIADIPALGIVVLITWLIYVGISESKRTNNFFVLLKLAAILLVIAVGSFYVNPKNWSPFAPEGIGGVLKGVSAVFFAYIGFDAISTTAEECRNPQRDLPRSMIYSLIICTVLYVIITMILTGMVHYKQLAVGDPLAFVFEYVGLSKLSGIISIIAVVALSSVLLVFQMGQPRIWMSMSRDGLLPKRFSRIHPKYRTPSFATLVTGVVVAVPALFMNLKEVTDLTSIGTLFAFVLVCAGILVREQDPDYEKSTRFKVPYVNGKWIIPALLVIGILLLVNFHSEGLERFFSFKTPGKFFAGALWERLPMLGFLVCTLALAILTFIKKLSLIPVLGLLSNFYLMTELHISNWERFFVWLLIGLVIYFVYGRRHSKLNTAHGH